MASSRRLESALAAIESLPALPVAAVRLAAAGAHAPEAQAMAREASSSVMGRRSGVRTFASARNAVLSICVLRAVHENRQVDLWRHALRTAVAARTLSPDDPETAFLAGLMTPVGASVLDIIAPRTSARIERLAEQLGTEPDAIERRLLGMDRHDAGRRLADRWRLPMAVREALRLRGAPAEAVAHHPAASLLGAVALAEDWSRDGSLDETRIACLGMAPSRVRAAVDSLEQRLAGLSAVYGWAETPNPDLQRASLAWARQLLARWDAAAPGEPVDAGIAPADGCAAMADVLRAGAADGVVAILCQDEASHPWLAHWGAGPGAWRWLDPPTPGRDLLRVASAEPFGAPLVEAAPWLADHLPAGWRARDLTVRALPGSRAVLLLRADARVESHLKTWSGRLADARDRDQARRIEGAWRAASENFDGGIALAIPVRDDWAETYPFHKVIKHVTAGDPGDVYAYLEASRQLEKVVERLDAEAPG